MGWIDDHPKEFVGALAWAILISIATGSVWGGVITLVFFVALWLLVQALKIAALILFGWLICAFRLLTGDYKRQRQAALVAAWREVLSDPDLSRWTQARPFSEEEQWQEDDRHYEQHRQRLVEKAKARGDTG